MSLASPRVVNIKDMRRMARARLPDAVFDYLDGAADDEVTLKRFRAGKRLGSY